MLFRRHGRDAEAEREAKARDDERQAAIERLKRAAEQDAEYLREVERRSGETDQRRPRGR